MILPGSLPLVCWQRRFRILEFNSDYVAKAKDIKAAEAESKQMEARVKKATLSKSAR